MKIRLLSLILLFICTFSFVKAQNKPDAAQVKYKLCLSLLSCQSMTNTIIAENDYKTKIYLANIGLEYYNRASQQYIKLQDPEYGELSEELKKGISTLLASYGNIFSDISMLNQPASVVALAFMDDIYKTEILPELWDKK